MQHAAKADAARCDELRGTLRRATQQHAFFEVAACVTSLPIIPSGEEMNAGALRAIGSCLLYESWHKKGVRRVKRRTPSILGTK